MPDLRDQGRSDLGKRNRQNVVRSCSQALGRLVGSDYDEQVHGDMLADRRVLCIEIVEFGWSGPDPAPRRSNRCSDSIPAHAAGEEGRSRQRM